MKLDVFTKDKYIQELSRIELELKEDLH